MPAARPPMQQVPLALSEDLPQRFDTYLPAQVTAWEALCAHLQRPQAGVPVYVWGPQGSGKTHVLRAAAAHAAEQGGRVAAFDAATPLPWPVTEGHSLIVLDDCHRYDAAQQHAAFAAFIEAASWGVPVVAAGASPPVDLPVRDDLRSRLAWGLVYQLDAPDEARVRQRLMASALHRGLNLPPEVLDYVLHRWTRNLNHLMPLLDQLDRESLVAQRAITIPLVREVMARSALGGEVCA